MATSYSYDRRGRGESGNSKPYSVQREIEDIEALIDNAGGSAYVYGKSSGASLALQAAAVLGGKIKKLALYEPPYSEADGAAKEWKAFTAKLDGLLAADRRADAITLFMKFVGAPDDDVAKMKASPAWPGMLAMAPTLAYDNAVVGDDRSVPVGIAAKVKASTLVMDGSAGLELFFASNKPGPKRFRLRDVKVVAGHDTAVAFGLLEVADGAALCRLTVAYRRDREGWQVIHEHLLCHGATVQRLATAVSNIGARKDRATLHFISSPPRISTNSRLWSDARSTVFIANHKSVAVTQVGG